MVKFFKFFTMFNQHRLVNKYTRGAILYISCNYIMNNKPTFKYIQKIIYQLIGHRLNIIISCEACGQ